MSMCHGVSRAPFKEKTVSAHFKTLFLTGCVGLLTLLALPSASAYKINGQKLTRTQIKKAEALVVQRLGVDIKDLRSAFAGVIAGDLSKTLAAKRILAARDRAVEKADPKNGMPDPDVGRAIQVIMASTSCQTVRATLKQSNLDGMRAYRNILAPKTPTQPARAYWRTLEELFSLEAGQGQGLAKLFDSLMK
jgi:hypothetical protein